jgi:hypothetical protein
MMLNFPVLMKAMWAHNPPIEYLTMLNYIQ